jgi:hypothetical protein
MSCGCQQCGSGLGDLARFYGLRGLGILDMAPMKAGAAFELGVELNGWDVNFGSDTPYLMTNLLEAIRTAILNTGYVTDLQVYSMAGVTDWNPYIAIKGRAKYEHGSASHLRDIILGAVGSVIEYNPPVNFNADTYNPATGQVQTERTGPSATGGGSNTPPPSGKKECKWSEMSFGNYIACQLGIDDAVGGVKAGATGAILGVAVITAVALVLIKR